MKITVIYGEGEPKKHSVRFKVQTCSAPSVDIRQLGDIYVSRDLLSKLGGDFESILELSYELAATKG